jgi:hypothetical protein
MGEGTKRREKNGEGKRKEERKKKYKDYRRNAKVIFCISRLRHLNKYSITQHPASNPTSIGEFEYVYKNYFKVEDKKKIFMASAT